MILPFLFWRSAQSPSSPRKGSNERRRRHGKTNSRILRILMDTPSVQPPAETAAADTCPREARFIRGTRSKSRNVARGQGEKSRPSGRPPVWSQNALHWRRIRLFGGALERHPFGRRGPGAKPEYLRIVGPEALRRRPGGGAGGQRP